MLVSDFNTGLVTIALLEQALMNTALNTVHLPVESNTQDKVSLVFAVENVDAACQALKGQGVQLVDDPVDHPIWGVRAAHFRDPDGNLIEIYHSLPSWLP